MNYWKKWKPLLPAVPNLTWIIHAEMVDEYEQDEIIDYFKSCETSLLTVARKSWPTAILMGATEINAHQVFWCEYGNWISDFLITNCGFLREYPYFCCPIRFCY